MAVDIIARALAGNAASSGGSGGAGSVVDCDICMTDEELLVVLAEEGIIDIAASNADAIYTDKGGTIYVL